MAEPIIRALGQLLFSTLPYVPITYRNEGEVLECVFFMDGSGTYKFENGVVVPGDRHLTPNKFMATRHKGKTFSVPGVWHVLGDSLTTWRARGEYFS